MATNQGLYYYTKEEMDELIANRFAYSTTEKEVGTWIDNSPLYRKTIDFGALPNADSKNVAHNISNLDKVVKIEGIAIAGNRAFPLPHVDTGDAITGIRITVEGAEIQIRTGMDRTAWHGYVTLYYTKVETND